MTIKQDQVMQRGHAIECRIYAEDPQNQFLPSTGVLHYVEPPRGVNVRNDTGIEQGTEVTSFYDPLLAKLTVYGETRNETIQKMMWALSNYVILGVTTNISFLKRVLDHQSFRNGDITTHFIDEHRELFSESGLPDEALIAAALAETLRMAPEPVQAHVETQGVSDPYSPWKSAGDWSNV